MPHPRLSLVAALLALAACRADARPASPAAAARAPRPGAVIDSAMPIAEALRRFRADLLRAPSGFENGAASRDSLVGRWVRAVEANDTAALEPLAINRAEFAYLYYPTDPQARPPYELPPGLMWFQMQERSRQGAFRLLREFGGEPLGYAGYRCDPQPQIQGPNRIWKGCVVRLARTAADTAEVRLFGAILEHGGRFAFLSYANDL